MHRKSVDLEIICGRENQHPERLGPKPSVEQPKRTGKKRSYGQYSIGHNCGSICCSSIRFPTSFSHTTLSNKVRGISSKNCVGRLYCVVVMILHAYVDVYVLCVCIVGCNYTTIDINISLSGGRNWCVFPLANTVNDWTEITRKISRYIDPKHLTQAVNEI